MSKKKFTLCVGFLLCWVLMALTGCGTTRCFNCVGPDGYSGTTCLPLNCDFAYEYDSHGESKNIYFDNPVTIDTSNVSASGNKNGIENAENLSLQIVQISQKAKNALKNVCLLQTSSACDRDFIQKLNEQEQGIVQEFFQLEDAIVGLNQLFGNDNKSNTTDASLNSPDSVPQYLNQANQHIVNLNTLINQTPTLQK